MIRRHAVLIGSMLGMFGAVLAFLAGAYLERNLPDRLPLPVVYVSR